MVGWCRSGGEKRTEKEMEKSKRGVEERKMEKGGS